MNNKGSAPREKDPTAPAIPKSETQQALGFEKQKMVAWFNPVCLFEIAARVLISIIFGHYSDKREIQAALNKSKTHSYKDDNELWFDYVSDIGDGWNSTFTMAKILGEEQLTAQDPNKQSHHTQRGRFLIMGGDEVYPSPSRDAYRNRTIGPYRAALPWVDNEAQAPHLYALPGNHDWYDGLTSFTRLFCQQRWIGGWQTQQSHSYFAIQLPNKWWLFAIDLQLGADIDKPQLDYFERMISNLQSGAHVILASASPTWIFDSLSGGSEHENICYIEKRLKSQDANISVNIAGDLHHYAHYADTKQDRHKFTAGGGGAFLHGTHLLPKKLRLNEASGNNDYQLDEESLFPSRRTSHRLMRNCLGFAVKNWPMSLFFGVYFSLTFWIIKTANYFLLPKLASITPTWLSAPIKGICHFGRALLYSPASSALFVMLVLAMIAFCQPNPEKSSKKMRFKKVILGGLHGLSHLILFMLLSLFFIQINESVFNESNRGWLLIPQLIVVGGFMQASLFGLYLYLSGRFFNAHIQEAFSCHPIEDYKNFLRFHIHSDGKLTIYPMGIKKVEKNWRLNAKGKAGDSWFVSPNNKPMSDYVHLISKPITISINK